MAGPIFVTVFVLLMAVLVPLLGTDSRDGRDWQPRDQWVGLGPRR